jgi:pimeloyl-ACP methyl ester carboxylesterase
MVRWHLADPMPNVGGIDREEGAQMTTGWISWTALLAMMVTCAGCAANPEPTSDPQASDPDERVDTLPAPGEGPRPTIVLIHGAFADGTSWQKVIPLLERDGYPVIAVQNTLTGVADDVVTTKRVIDAAAEKGPVVAVAHSYGGVVMTAAAVNPAVKALVYVDAFAPEAGEVLGVLAGRFGPSPLEAALVPDAAGFLTIDRAKFQDVFCADVTKVEARVAAAAQKPLASAVFEQSVPVAAWEEKPSWYLVGKEDQAIIAELQRFMAERIKAHISEIHSSHASFISHPRFVTRLIEEAARATK